MNVTIKKEGNDLFASVEGKVDTLTAPQLGDKLAAELEGVTKVTFDFKELEYISSAGLRVLVLTAQKMGETGEIVIKNVNNDIMGIFEATGFDEAFKFE